MGKIKDSNEAIKILTKNEKAVTSYDEKDILKKRLYRKHIIKIIF